MVKFKSPEVIKKESAEKMRKSIIVWVMILAIVGSTVGFAIMSSSGNNNQSNDDGAPEPEPPTQLAFTASGVEGQLITIFNTFYVLAYSDKEIKEIDDAIYSVEGIRKVNSGWISSSGSGIGTPIYKAQVYFENEAKLSYLNEKIRALEVFEYAEVIGSGVVEVPQTITIKSEDLNITKEHTLADALVNAEFSGIAEEGDILRVELSMLLSGATETTVLAREEENLSATPQQVSLKSKFTVAELKPEMLLNAGGNITAVSDVDVNALIDEIKDTNNVYSAEISAAEIQPSFSIALDGNHSHLLEDINTALNTIEGLNFNLFLQYDLIFADYGLEYDFALIKMEIEEKLAEIDVNISKIEEPRLNLSGTITLDSENAVDSAVSIYTLLSEKGFELSLKQPAVFMSDSITNPDDDVSYLVKDGNFIGLLTPVHDIGAEVELDVFFQAIRGKAEYINAQEYLEPNNIE